MRIYDIIAKKRDGGKLTPEEIAFFVTGCVDHSIPDYQISALLMAICLQGMDARETAELTLAMARSGESVDLSSIPGIKVDKHSTGGVGDKTTLVAAPIAASLGVPIAKMSGRGLGHTGGTIDKLEAIPGLRTDLSREEFLETVRRVGVCVAGQSSNLDPADKKLYALRDVTATVESLPLIASSIMSKKIAAGADRILLDVKTGSGAFMKTIEASMELAKAMVQIGESVGRETVAMVTDMDRPLGNAIGNALEIVEVCETLQGRGPADLTELCMEIAAQMLYLGSKGTAEECRMLARQAIADGRAFRKLKEMVVAQGGDPASLDDYGKLPRPAAEQAVLAPADGWICAMDTQKIGIAAVELGAGREKKGGQIDYAAGIVLRKKPGDWVRKGEPLAMLYAARQELFAAGEQCFLDALTIGEKPPMAHPLILGLVDRKSL